MTVEDLSLATADRYETKMLHDVKSITRTRAPPRPDPPLFGRESMEDAVSARAAVMDESEQDSNTRVAAPIEKTAIKPRTVTIEDEINAFFTTFQRVESRLHMYLTNDDKVRIRTALSSPTQSVTQRIASDPGTTSLVVSVVLTVVVLYVCGHVRKVHMPYRSSNTGGGDRSETVSWNIGRLLKPLIHPR